MLAAGVVLGGACGDDDAGESTTTRPGGTVSVVVSDLVGREGDQLAGVLLERGEGVAGFVTTVDADPFSSVMVLGDVSEEWGEGEDGVLWPWASGVASLPAGEYTLRVAMGRDFCCYSRWMPAATPGLHLCDVNVTITGEDQEIEITEIPLPNQGACGMA